LATGTRSRLPLEITLPKEIQTIHSGKSPQDFVQNIKLSYDRSEWFQVNSLKNVHLLKGSRQLLGNQLQITWLDEQHWHLEGTVAILDIVWWLEVKGTFLGVLKGTYVPVLHLEFHTAMELENVICAVSVDSTLGQVLPSSPKGDTLDDDSLSHRAPNPPCSNSLH
jgi:hypothetical protein